MFREDIDNSYIVMQEGTSEGTQIKYRKDGFWYKKDNRGNEGRAEYLGKGFSVDVKGALAWLEQERESIERNVLMYQIKRYTDLLTG